MRMMYSEVRKLIQFACDANGRPDIADMIRVQWSNRMVRSMGYASRQLIDSHNDYVIKLSTPLFARANEEQQRQTVIHEACHVIDSVVNKVHMSHGHSWKECMRKCGVQPDRCHTVSTSGLVNRWTYHCPNCKQTFSLSTRFHNQIVRGRLRVCKRCNTIIVRDNT